MLQLLSSDTVSLASGLAAHETDDKRSLTRLTDTPSGEPGARTDRTSPAAWPVGAAQPGERDRVSRRYSSVNTVQVYTG